MHNNKLQVSLFVLFPIFLILLFYTMFASAHEPRIIGNGNFSVSVGSLVEPVFEDVPNGFNINISSADGTPVDTANGGTVNLMVKVLFLETDSMDAKVLASAMLKEPLSKIFGTENRYRIHYKPTHDGAYGYLITGDINGIEIDEKFVCGGGSLAAPRAFGCVVDPQAFPGNDVGEASDDIKDEAGYKDNDKYSLGGNKD